MQMSLRVSLVGPEMYQVVADAVTGRPGVEYVVDQRSILEPLFLILNRATLLAAGLAALMTITAIMLITTTIRLRSEEHTSELQSRGHLVCRLLLEKKQIIPLTCLRLRQLHYTSPYMI